MAITNSLRKINDEFRIEHVGSSLLNELAKGLYTAESVLREYIQNAVDAHRLWEAEVGRKPEWPIQIEFRDNSGISILDYGIGMAEDEARNVKSVAVSPKRNPTSGVELTGHKGVGIWAGLSFFESLTLRTTKRGIPKGFQIVIYFKRILDAIDEKTDIGSALNPNYEIYEFAADPESHYTDVTLNRPTQEVGFFLDAEKIEESIRRICPCKINPNFVFHDEVTEWHKQHGFDLFDIELDGRPVYRDYSSAVEDFKTETLTINDTPVAEVWHAVTKKAMLRPNSGQLVGFRISQSGFVIGDTNPYSARALSGFDEISVGQYPNWFVGEIHVTSVELRPNLPRTDFEESELKRKFVQKIRRWYDAQDVQCRILSQRRNRLGEYQKFENRIREIVKQSGAPVALSDENATELIDIQSELNVDEAIAGEDKRGRAPKSTVNIEARRQNDVKNKRKELLDLVKKLLSASGRIGQSTIEDSSRSHGEETTGGKEPSLGSQASTESKPSPETRSNHAQAEPVIPSQTSLLAGNGPEEEQLSRRVSISVVLTLLEEILAETLPDDRRLQEDVLRLLQIRLQSVAL